VSSRARRALAAAATVLCAGALAGGAAQPASAHAGPGTARSHLVQASGTMALRRVGTVSLSALAHSGGRRGSARGARRQNAGVARRQNAGVARRQNAGVARRQNASVARRQPERIRVTPLRLPPGAVGVTGTGVAGGSLTTKWAGNVPGARGFNGLTSASSGAINSRRARGVGYVSPPDPTLAVGQSPKGTAVLEFVNEALAVYSPAGKTLLAPVPAFRLFGLPASALLSDPRVFHESAGTGYWTLTASVAGDGVTAPLSTQYFAVSRTANPFGQYAIFSLDTADQTDTAGGCPCFGVFDQLGEAGAGTYISVSQFSVDHANFDGSVIYVIRGITRAAERPDAPAPLAYVYTLPSSGDPFGAFDLSPSQYAPGTAPNDAEYFVESDADAAGGSGLEVYALLYATTFGQGKPPILAEATVPTEPYSLPPDAIQRRGPTPYGCAVKSCATAMLDTDFDAVQEVTWVNGILYAELDTGVTVGSTRRSGVAWFALRVTPHRSTVSASLVSDGYLETSPDILDPAIAVNGLTGMGELAFAVSGPARYPSAAYVAFDGTSGPAGPIRVAARGADPLDDFSCYPKFSRGQCRYGDYASAQYWRGRIYMAAEYVARRPRDTVSNWSTRIWSVPVARQPG
jgi:hypothetical protein